MLTAAQLNTLKGIADGSHCHIPGDELQNLFERAVSVLPSVERYCELDLPVRRLAPIADEIDIKFGASSRAAFAVMLVARLALRQLSSPSGYELPASVLKSYSEAINSFIGFAASDDLAGYFRSDDAFLKDVRIAAGYSVPCGAQDVDLHSSISKLSGVKAVLVGGRLHAAVKMLLIGGPTWFRIHTDPRRLGDFNEEGWSRCYRQIAELLIVRPAVKGMVGTSWFYDPQLTKISPKLAYLQATPLSHGAFLVRHGPGAIHSERATTRSPTRKALFECGKYLPECYSLVWRRDDLLNWAEST